MGVSDLQNISAMVAPRSARRVAVTSEREVMHDNGDGLMEGEQSQIFLERRVR